MRPSLCIVLTLEVHARADLVDVPVHAALADHVRGDALGPRGRRLE